MSKTKKEVKGVNIKNSKLILYLCFFTFLTALTILNVSIFLYTKPMEIKLGNNKPDNRIAIWNSFLIKHPDYFQGWVELSYLEIKNGNSELAKTAFMNAKKINPNSEEIFKLEDNISIMR